MHVGHGLCNVISLAFGVFSAKLEIRKEKTEICLDISKRQVIE